MRNLVDDDAFDWKAAHNFIVSQVPHVSGTFEIDRFTGGFSNLTFLVSIGDTELVVKRPPAGPRAKGAHDMGREFTMLNGLHDQFPYCPRALAFCGDTTVAGAEFLVMERLVGQVIRPDVIKAEGLNHDEISKQLTTLVKALAALHAIDAKIALPGFGKPEGYRERQRESWIARFEAAQTDDAADFSNIIDWIRKNTPESRQNAAPIHNDFKLDNLMWTGPRLQTLRGVLDWEMATVGDPLMDLSCTLSFWVQNDDPEPFKQLRAMPSGFEGAPSRADALQIYAHASGRPLDRPDFLLCFGLFRRAVIEQQKYARFKRGHSSDPRYADLNGAVEVIRDMCREVCSGRM
jgi:aminoglycoside phosphotransferase (APT) family kinase protein